MTDSTDVPPPPSAPCLHHHFSGTSTMLRLGTSYLSCLFGAREIGIPTSTHTLLHAQESRDDELRR